MSCIATLPQHISDFFFFLFSNIESLSVASAKKNALAFTHTKARDVEPQQQSSEGCQTRVRFTCLVPFQALKLAAYCKSTKERREQWWKPLWRGGKRGRFFPLRASCYYFASGAKQWEMNVLCLWDLTQNTMYAHASAGSHTRVLIKTDSSISMRWR